MTAKASGTGPITLVVAGGRSEFEWFLREESLRLHAKIQRMPAGYNGYMIAGSEYRLVEDPYKMRVYRHRKPKVVFTESAYSLGTYQIFKREAEMLRNFR